MSHVMNTYARLPVNMVRGAGPWLWDDQGKRYLDSITGIGVCSLGHAHPRLVAALEWQSRLLWHTSNMVGIPAQEALADRLARLSGLDRAFFCNSGAEANECGFKFARAYGVQRGLTNPKIVVVSHSFHGRTLACIAATDNPKVSDGFGPLLDGFLRAPFGDAAAVNALFERHDDIAAVMVEPILGEGGVVVPADDYLPSLRALCDANEALLIADEVQSGLCKSGAWFGFQHAGIEVDAICLAKALGNGFPIGACVVAAKHADVLSPGRHGSTYGGNPLGCAVANEVLTVMEDENLATRAHKQGERLRQQLAAGLQRTAIVKEIRGRGLMVGIELNTPGAPYQRQALASGLLMNVTRDKTIRLLPPLICEDAVIDELGDRLIALLTA